MRPRPRRSRCAGSIATPKSRSRSPEESAIPDLDQYLEAIAAGEPDAFAAWLAGAEPQIRRSLRSFAPFVDTEAVLQEALLRVWQLAPRSRGDGKQNGLLRFGLQTARNLAISQARRARAVPFEIAELPDPADPRSAPDPHLQAAVQECRSRLPRQPGRALAARLDAAGSEPDRTLAERVGMKLNTFLQNITRARKLLADCLRRRGVDLDVEQS